MQTAAQHAMAAHSLIRAAKPQNPPEPTRLELAVSAIRWAEKTALCAMTLCRLPCPGRRPALQLLSYLRHLNGNFPAMAFAGAREHIRRGPDLWTALDTSSPLHVLDPALVGCGTRTWTCSSQGDVHVEETQRRLHLGRRPVQSRPPRPQPMARS